jgi:hypothetical protein
VDPWVLADQVANSLDAFSHLAKHASDPRARQMSRFYVAWADDVEKRAGLAAVKGLVGAGRAAMKGGLGGGLKGLRSRVARGYRKGVGQHQARVARGGGDAGRGKRLAQARLQRMQDAAPVTSSRSGGVNLGPGRPKAPPAKTQAPAAGQAPVPVPGAQGPVTSTRSGGTVMGNAPPPPAPVTSTRSGGSVATSQAPTPAPAPTTAPAAGAPAAGAPAPQTAPPVLQHAPPPAPTAGAGAGGAGGAAAATQRPVDWRSVGYGAAGGAAASVPLALMLGGGQAPPPQYY